MSNLNDGESGSDIGHVLVYQYNPGGGEGNGEWEKLGQDIDGEAAGDKSGYSVSLSSDGTIVALEHLIMMVKVVLTEDMSYL